MNPEDVPPQFQDSKRPEPPPDVAGEMPPDEPPPRAPEPFLRRN